MICKNIHANEREKKTVYKYAQTHTRKMFFFVRAKPFNFQWSMQKIILFF